MKLRIDFRRRSLARLGAFVAHCKTVEAGGAAGWDRAMFRTGIKSLIIAAGNSGKPGAIIVCDAQVLSRSVFLSLFLSLSVYAAVLSTPPPPAPPHTGSCGHGSMRHSIHNFTREHNHFLAKREISKILSKSL